MKRNAEELKKNILKTLEMSSIYKNSRSKLEPKKEKKQKRENALS
jgi:hypothetical protein